MFSKKDRAKMTILFEDKDLEEIKNCIDKIFGIHSYHIAYIVDNDSDIIKEKVLEILKKEDFKSFKIETKRSNKNVSREHKIKEGK